jgi:hypothetical protein
MTIASGVDSMVIAKTDPLVKKMRAGSTNEKTR